MFYRVSLFGSFGIPLMLSVALVWVTMEFRRFLVLVFCIARLFCSEHMVRMVSLNKTIFTTDWISKWSRIKPYLIIFLNYYWKRVEKRGRRPCSGWEIRSEDRWDIKMYILFRIINHMRRIYKSAGKIVKDSKLFFVKWHTVADPNVRCVRFSLSSEPS